jgi:hypothetical protein
MESFWTVNEDPSGQWTVEGPAGTQQSVATTAFDAFNTSYVDCPCPHPVPPWAASTFAQA